MRRQKMKQITKAIIVKEFKGKECPKQCLFYTKEHINPPIPCSREVVPFLTKYLGLPKCSEGYIYVEEGK
jgi:hypothetical protein